MLIKMNSALRLQTLALTAAYSETAQTVAVDI